MKRIIVVDCDDCYWTLEGRTDGCSRCFDDPTPAFEEQIEGLKASIRILKAREKELEALYNQATEFGGTMNDARLAGVSRVKELELQLSAMTEITEKWFQLYKDEERRAEELKADLESLQQVYLAQAKDGREVDKRNLKEISLLNAALDVAAVWTGDNPQEVRERYLDEAKRRMGK